MSLKRQNNFLPLFVFHTDDNRADKIRLRYLSFRLQLIEPIKLHEKIIAKI